MLTDKQKRFVQEYLIDYNATQAAIRAGYSKKSARRIGEDNLKKPDIKTYIDSKLKEIEDAKTATAKEVREYFTSVMRGEVKETVLCLVGDGVQMPIEISVPVNARNKAAELLGKTYGLFTEKIDAEVDTEISIKIDYGDDD